MLQFIMERNLLLYVLAAACAVGAVSQMILKQVYERLIRDTRNNGQPEGRFMQQLRQRFQYCAHLNEKVGDVRALIRKGLMEYRFWGMSLHQWKRLGGVCLVVSLLCSLGGAALHVQNGAMAAAGVTYLWLGVAAAALTAAAYGIADTGYRSECLEVRLVDYLENSGAVRDYSESAEEEFEEEQVMVKEETRVPIVSVASIGKGRKMKRRARAETAAAQAKAAMLQTKAAAAQAKAETAAMKTAAVQTKTDPVQSKAQKDKKDLKENIARIRAGMQETAAELEQSSRERNVELLRQMDAKEQERILREVLKEFLS